ncbi:MAG: hypothetical protein R2873_34635 [Caldilineaceae bacterium]
MYDDIYRIPLVAHMPGGRSRAVDDPLRTADRPFRHLPRSSETDTRPPAEYAGRSIVPFCQRRPHADWLRSSSVSSTGITSRTRSA